MNNHLRKINFKINLRRKCIADFKSLLENLDGIILKRQVPICAIIFGIRPSTNNSTAA